MIAKKSKFTSFLILLLYWELVKKLFSLKYCEGRGAGEDNNVIARPNTIVRLLIAGDNAPSQCTSLPDQETSKSGNKKQVS